MKNLSSFEAFKLNKNQMNAVAGGVQCRVTYSDALGGSFSITIDQNVTVGEAERTLKAQHPDAAGVVCR